MRTDANQFWLLPRGISQLFPHRMLPRRPVRDQAPTFSIPNPVNGCDYDDDGDDDDDDDGDDKLWYPCPIFRTHPEAAAKSRRSEFIVVGWHKISGNSRYLSDGQLERRRWGIGRRRHGGDGSWTTDGSGEELFAGEITAR